MSASGHPGPSASASSSTRARRASVDEPDNVFTTCSNVARSASVSRTRCFFRMVGPSGETTRMTATRRPRNPKSPQWQSTSAVKR